MNCILNVLLAQPNDLTTDQNSGDYVYASSYTPNGIFHSSDGGDTWEGLPNDVDYGAGRSVVVDATSGDVYGVIGDNLIKSTDHGETWTKLTANLVDNPIMSDAAIFANGILMVATTAGGVQVSADGGETFTAGVINEATDNTSSRYVVSFSADSAGTFYAILQDESADSSTLYRSTDAGGSWTVMDVAASGVASGARFYGVAVDPLDDDHVVLSSYHPSYDSYHSLDGGTSWLVLENDGQNIGADEAVFTGAGNLYIGIYFTEDPQSISPTWTAIETTTPLSSVRGDIYAVDYTHPLTLYTNTGLGIAKSEDGGTTWVDQLDGLTAVQTFAISQADDKAVVWVGANGGLARTTNFTDDSPTWDFPILPESGISSVKAVWVKPDNSDTVIAGLSDFISISTDGGDTWDHVAAPAFSGTVEQIVPSPSDDQMLYAIYTNSSLTEDEYNGGVLKSTDGGSSWSELNFPTTLSNGAIAVTVRNDNDIVYVGVGLGGSTTGVYMYTGDDWEKLAEDFNGLGVNDILVHPEDNNIVFVSCEADSTVGSLFKSTDSGATWDTITSGLDDMNHLGAMTAQSDGATLYLVGQVGGSGEGIILKSTDTGDSWSEYYLGKKQEFFYTLLFDGLIAGNDRGLFNLKSYGKIKLTTKSLSGQRQRLTVTLKDAATKTVLPNRQVSVYKKPPGKGWQTVRSHTTTAKGKVRFTVTAKRNTKLKIVWKPKQADRAEYTRTTSRVVTVD